MSHLFWSPHEYKSYNLSDMSLQICRHEPLLSYYTFTVIMKLRLKWEDLATWTSPNLQHRGGSSEIKNKDGLLRRM